MLLPVHVLMACFYFVVEGMLLERYIPSSFVTDSARLCYLGYFICYDINNQYLPQLC